MTRSEDTHRSAHAAQSQYEQEKKSEKPAKLARPISKHVTDHLANERTFLAWLRTGIALIAFGFVIARFSLLLRELSLKAIVVIISFIHFSSLIGILFVLLGVVVIAVALWNFVENKRDIDREQFCPRSGLPIFLTILIGLIGIILAIYLFYSA